MLHHCVKLCAKLYKALVKHLSIVRIDNSRPLINLPSHLSKINRKANIA